MTSRISTPRHYSVTNALKATGQDKIADPDPGSPAQRLHDQCFGVSYIGDRVALPVEIAAVVVPEATGEAPTTSTRSAWTTSVRSKLRKRFSTGRAHR
jgi:hypothetical protein